MCTRNGQTMQNRADSGGSAQQLPGVCRVPFVFNFVSRPTISSPYGPPVCAQFLPKVALGGVRAELAMLGTPEETHGIITRSGSTVARLRQEMRALERPEIPPVGRGGGVSTDDDGANDCCSNFKRGQQWRATKKKQKL